jgi:SAM-dependent methyltransferase
MKNPVRDVISHYSDPRTAAAFHDDRYGGPMGSFFLAEEATRFRTMIHRFGHCSSILDLGAGTGKLAATVSAPYMAMDRSVAMLHMLRTRTPTVPLVVGDAQALPFRSQSVDILCASRLLMHLPDWPLMAAESCRVARRAVILDFPVSPSLAALEPRLWPLCRRDAHPPHRVFTVREVRRVFAQHGFREVTVHRGFVLPYRLHRLLKTAWVSHLFERVVRGVGLAYLLGSPAFAAFSPTGTDRATES